MLTNDDIATLRASAQAAIRDPRRVFAITPEVALSLVRHIESVEKQRKLAQALADISVPRAHRYFRLQEMHPGQFAELYQRKLRGESFDALVDELGAK